MPTFQSESADAAAEGLDDFTAAYILAMYWTDTGDSEQPCSEAALSPSSRVACINDCARFQSQHFNLLAEMYAAGKDEAQAGHDFWLTRNSHGAGYWDRGLPGDLGERLTEAAKAFGTVDTCGEYDNSTAGWVLYCN